MLLPLASVKWDLDPVATWVQRVVSIDIAQQRGMQLADVAHRQRAVLLHEGEYAFKRLLLRRNNLRHPLCWLVYRVVRHQACLDAMLNQSLRRTPVYCVRSLDGACLNGPLTV